jgi:hypothetical protein
MARWREPDHQEEADLTIPPALEHGPQWLHPSTKGRPMPDRERDAEHRCVVARNEYIEENHVTDTLRGLLVVDNVRHRRRRLLAFPTPAQEPPK